MSSIILSSLLLLAPLFGGCVNSNGGSIEVDYGAQNAAELTGDMTLSLWIQMGNTGAADGYLIALSGAGEGEPENFLWSVRCAAAGCATFEFFWEYSTGSNETAASVAQGTAGWDSDEWTYFAFVRDVSDNEVTVYVLNPGGTLYSETDSYTNDPTGGGSGEVTFFHALGSAQPTQDTVGLADVRVYDSELPANKIRQLAHGTNLPGAVLHIPSFNCGEDVHIGTGGQVSLSGTGETARRSPPIANPFY